MRIFKNIRRLIRVARDYDEDQSQLKLMYSDAIGRSDEAMKLMRERTTLGMDVGFNKHNDTHVILVGRYRNRDYVEVMTIDNDCFDELIPILKQMQKSSKISRIDVPFTLKEVIDREIKNVR